MTLGVANIVQSNSGNNSPTGTPTLTVSLSSATAGHTVLVGIAAESTVTSPPAGFVQDAVTSIGGSDTHTVYRKQLSTAETSWAFGMSNSNEAAWWVLEVSGLDPTAPFITGTSIGGQAGTSISSGTTSSVSQTDILVLAGFSGLHLTTSNTWSGYTNSFTEIVDQATASSGNQESIAVAYKFPGAGGTFTSTATASISVAATGLIVVYKAAPPPAVSIDNVVIGGKFVMLAEVTSRPSGDTHLDLYTDNTTTVQGSIVISSGLAVTGTMNYALSQIPAETSQVTFAVGAIVQSNTTGEVMVVRDSWIDAGGAEWSNTTTRATRYSTTGWTVIGSALLN